MSAGNRKHPYRVYPAPAAKQQESQLWFFMMLLIIVLVGVALGFILPG